MANSTNIIFRCSTSQKSLWESIAKTKGISLAQLIIARMPVDVLGIDPKTKPAKKLKSEIPARQVQQGEGNKTKHVPSQKTEMTGNKPFVCLLKEK